MENTDKKLETKRIGIFIGLTFLITYAYCFGVIYPVIHLGSTNPKIVALVTLLKAALMFFPAVGVLLTRLITKEGFQDAWLHPHLKGNVKTYLLAYFGPGILIVLGIGIYFLVFPSRFDPGFGYMKTALAAVGNGVEMEETALFTLMIVQTLTGFILGPVLNFITCFGEEWGWRGYLLPKMAKKLPAIPMLLINGIIWGLWHAPVIAIGHNYGVGYPGFPFVGIVAMCGFCIVTGIFLSYVSMKAQSCIPAVLGHGAINSLSGLGIFFMADAGNPFLGPAPIGIIGGIPFIITAVVLLVFYFCKRQA